jgi:hypothetical protein
MIIDRLLMIGIIGFEPQLSGTFRPNPNHLISKTVSSGQIIPLNLLIINQPRRIIPPFAYNLLQPFLRYPFPLRKTNILRLIA